MGDRRARREHERKIRDMDARMSELEEALGAARQRVGKLADDRETPDPEPERATIALIRAGHDGTRNWLGAPVLLRLSRRFDGELDVTCFDHIVETIRTVTQDPGVNEQMTNSLLWSSSSERHPIQPHLMIRITTTEAGPAKTTDPGQQTHYTTLIVTDRLEALAGRMFGAFGSVLGAGGIAAPVALSIAFPLLTPVFAAGWLAGVYGTSRFLYRRIARGRAQRVQQIFDVLVNEVEPHIR